MSCSLSGNVNFPIKLGFEASEEIYNSVASRFQLDIKWGERTTAPSFKSSDSDVTYAKLDEGILGGGNATTLLYEGNNYLLQYAQLHKPLHPEFIIPIEARESCEVELSLYFELQGDKSSVKGIWISVPLIADETVKTDPTYLLKLGMQDMTESTGLYSAMPAYNQNRFAFYNTCLADPNNIGASLGNLLVFVGVYGTHLSPDLLAKIKEQYGGGQQDWPSTYFKPALLSDLNPSATSLTEINYKNLLASSYQTVTAKGVAGYRPVSEDTLDSYKCVTLDPDTAVKDGTIQIDMNTGEPLNQTLDTRKAEMTDQQGIGISLTPGQVERFFANAVGIFLAVAFAFILFYLGFVLIGRRFFPNIVLPQWLQHSPMYLLIGFIFAFVGFMIGAAVS
jgi:hypothetical protein